MEIMSTLPANLGSRASRTYFLSPQIRRLRHSEPQPAPKRLCPLALLGRVVGRLDRLEGEGDPRQGDVAAVLAVSDHLGRRPSNSGSSWPCVLRGSPRGDWAANEA